MTLKSTTPPNTRFLFYVSDLGVRGFRILVNHHSRWNDLYIDTAGSNREPLAGTVLGTKCSTSTPSLAVFLDNFNNPLWIPPRMFYAFHADGVFWRRSEHSTNIQNSVLSFKSVATRSSVRVPPTPPSILPTLEAWRQDLIRRGQIVPQRTEPTSETI